MNARSALRVVTPTGWYVVLLVVATALLGVLWGWVEAWSVAILGACLLLIALPFLFGNRRYRVRLDVGNGSVVAGDELRVEVAVANESAGPQLPAVAELTVSAAGEPAASRDPDGPAASHAIIEVAVPLLGPHQSVRLPVSVPARERGVLRVGPTTVTRRDPLGLLRRELSWRDRHLVHVHPRTVPLPLHTAGMVPDLEGAAGRRLTDADLDFHAVREYAPGDEMRHVHWKATAKTGTLMVRQYEESQESRMAVLFDARPEEYGSDEEFELGVSIAASLSMRAVTSGREHFAAVTRRGRGPGLAELPTRSPVGLLDAWAEVERAENGPAIETAARGLASLRRALSVVALVTGSRPALTRIRHAGIAFPPEVRVLAVRCELLGDPRTQRLDPLTLCTVGALDDLPGLVLRGAL